MNVVTIHPCWLGHVSNRGDAVYGAILALREDGNQALFAPKNGGPLAWIPVGAFCFEESLILTPRQVKKHLGIEDWNGDEE